MRHVFVILFSKHKLLSKIAVLLTHILSLKELEVAADDHFNNGIRMSKWGTNYAWKKLREKVTKRANNVTIKFLTPETSRWTRRTGRGTVLPLWSTPSTPPLRTASSSPPASSKATSLARTDQLI